MLYKLIIIFFLTIFPIYLFGQKNNYCFSTSLAVGKNNFDKYPVKFGNGNHVFSQQIRSFDIELGIRKSNNYFGTIYQISTSKSGMVNSNNFAFYFGDAFQFKYARFFLNNKKFNICPYIKLGVQNGTFVYSNDTNYSNSSMNLGQSNEISTIITNPKGSFGFQFKYEISKTNFVSLFIEGSSGLVSSKVRNYSNSIIDNYTFNPIFFQFGATYTKSRF